MSHVYVWVVTCGTLNKFGRWLDSRICEVWHSEGAALEAAQEYAKAEEATPYGRRMFVNNDTGRFVHVALRASRT